MVTQMEAVAKTEGFKVLTQSMDRKKYASGDSVDESGHLNKPSTGMELMKDVWAMSSCDYFVGTMTYVQVSRVMD